jgi:hypothetical protein
MLHWSLHGCGSIRTSVLRALQLFQLCDHEGHRVIAMRFQLALAAGLLVGAVFACALWKEPGCGVLPGL